MNEGEECKLLLERTSSAYKERLPNVQGMDTTAGMFLYTEAGMCRGQRGNTYKFFLDKSRASQRLDG